ncbi:MAG: permease [Candidatus Bipolaricaulota bacterium]|nr:permease [Candidatus Bipolaricaulota bacterium]
MPPCLVPAFFIVGAILAVCSCTVLPLFAGIYKRGAGLGPAIAFLYSGSALSLPNVLVIRKVLGTKKTLAYITLVCIAATLTGKLFGTIIGA